MAAVVVLDTHHCPSWIDNEMEGSVSGVYAALFHWEWVVNSFVPRAR